MAEFSEVMRQWVRARKAINENELSCWPLEMFTDDYIANIEKEVMEWAAEHPEPVYPTFGEWLEKQGIVKLVNSDRYEEDGRKVYMLLESVENQIPAEIAERLGIEPKEDNMGLTEGHWFEDEYSLSERQLERAVEDEKAAYERGLRDGKHKLDWINANDTLPEESEDVLVYAEWESAGIDGVSKGEGVKIGWHVDGHWHIDGRCRVVAKYWTAIPELPEGESK